MEKDLHKIDKYLIRGGMLLLAIALMGTACSADSVFYEVVHPVDASRDAVRSTFHWRAMGGAESLRAAYPDAVSIEETSAGGAAFWYWLLAAATVMVGTGFYLHRKENRAVLLWNFVESGVEVSVPDVCASTGLTRPQISEALALINRQPRTHYIWDKRADVIIAGDLRNRFVMINQCGSCGANPNLRVSLDFATPPTCPYCGSATADPELNRLKQDALRELRQPHTNEPESRFSPTVFITLLVVFWPGAVIYALWKSGLRAKNRTASLN
ncbi:MAG: hypothetical protein AAF493_12095 [Pseudomonadota bacterium]